MTLLTGSTGVLLRSANRSPLGQAFTKDAGNPILTNGAPGSWEDEEVNGEHVFWDLRLEQFVMSYGGYDGTLLRIGIAYAASPAGPWTKEAANPVYTAPSNSAFASSILQLPDESYIMYLQRDLVSFNRIYALSSTDLVSWSDLNGGSPVLSPGAPGQWDDKWLFDPFPRQWPDGTIELFYGGEDASDDRGIGHATSPDGVTFTKQGLLFTPGAGEVSLGLGAPAVIGTQTHYSVYHDVTAGDGVRYINRMTTDDSGATFTREQGVLRKSASGWDGGQVFDASAIIVDGTEYLVYCGGVTGIGVGLDLESKVGVATREWPTHALAGA